MKNLFHFSGIIFALILASCASSSYKARQEQREKMVSSSGLYCEWISGARYSDVDVELNLQMGKRCDSSKPFSLASYKNSADQNGVLYCCSASGGEARGVKKGTIQKSASAPASGPTKSDGASGSSNSEIEEDK